MSLITTGSGMIRLTNRMGQVWFVRTAPVGVVTTVRNQCWRSGSAGNAGTNTAIRAGNVRNQRVPDTNPLIIGETDSAMPTVEVLHLGMWRW